MSLGGGGGVRSPDSTLHPRRRARSYAAGLAQRASTSTDEEHAAASGGGAAPGSGGLGGAGGLSGPQAMAGIGADPKAGAALAAVNVQRAAAAAGGLGGSPLAVGSTGTGGGGASPGYGTGAGVAVGSEHSMGAYGGCGGVPPVSTFGSLPSQLAVNSPVLSRVVQAHAPYLSKLESLASSATRCVRLTGLGGWAAGACMPGV